MTQRLVPSAALHLHILPKPTQEQELIPTSVEPLLSGLLEINPAMVELARLSAGMSQNQLADRLGIPQSRLSRIEDGLIQHVEVSLIGALATETGYPVDFFTQMGDRRPLTEAFYRKKKTISMKVLSMCEARINIKRLEVEKLLPKIDTSNFKSRPFWQPEEFQDGPREVARQLRFYWQLPQGPVKDVVEVVEDAGCVVVYFDFGTNKIDGVSMFTSSGTPLIFINPRFPGAKIRLTLAHELGHVIMHRVPTPQMEDEAFEFGCEFMMPEREIGPDLFPLNLERLQRLKLKWKVSMQAILMWAKKLGRIKDSYYSFLMMKISQAGYRMDEPHDDLIRPETPSLLAEIVDYHLKYLNYTKQELRKLLRPHIQRFEEYFVNMVQFA